VSIFSVRINSCNAAHLQHIRNVAATSLQRHAAVWPATMLTTTTSWWNNIETRCTVEWKEQSWTKWHRIRRNSSKLFHRSQINLFLLCQDRVVWMTEKAYNSLHQPSKFSTWRPSSVF